MTQLRHCMFVAERT